MIQNYFSSKLSKFLILLLSAFILKASDPAWVCEFAKADLDSWRFNNTQYEKVNGRLRVRVSENKSNYGTFLQYATQGGPEYYLQVQMGDLEDSKASPRVNNLSTGGKSLGRLLPGWNTFSLADVKNTRWALALVQNGTRGQAAGPWVDYIQARIIKVPSNGLTVSLDSKDGKAKVGDNLIFRYYPEGELPFQTLDVRCFIIPNFTEYHFNGEPVIKLRMKNGIYEARVAITADAMNYQSGPTTRLMASANINGVNTHFTMPFEADIKTANAIPDSVIAAATPQVRDDRMLWYERTKGTNLALGNSVLMFPSPDYRLTKDTGDATDLTNGKLTNRTDDKVWFDRSAVGWIGGSSNDRFMKIDLGEIQPLDRLVIRCLGGTTGNFKFPKQFDLYVSKDDDKFFNSAAMQKLMPAESIQSDFEKYYYLEENGSSSSTRMYPFNLNIKAEARYVILKITGESGYLFSDELAVIKAENKEEDFNKIYETSGISIPMSGLLIRPRVEELAIIEGIPAPQTFIIQDMRDKEELKQIAEMVIELPEWLKMEAPSTKNENIDIDGQKYIRYFFHLKSKKDKLQSPFIFLNFTQRKDGDKVFIYARSDGKDQHKTTLPLKIVQLPEIKPFERLHISLAWMHEKSGMAWPNFLVNWRKFGFNAVSSFPRYWTGGGTAQKEYLEQARKAGFKIVMNESPFHGMMRGQKEGSEIYCRIPGGENKILCPSYRGPLYQKELDRVLNGVKGSKPDYIFYDIECWHYSTAGAAKCTRCQEAFEKSGKTFNEFIFTLGQETIRDLKEAVKTGSEQAGIQMPIIGSYNRQPRHAKYGIEDFNMIYPAYIDMAQPSLYVAGRAYDVHNNIRDNHKLLKNKKLIPWLTAGCYGEFESYKMEQMVLEALLNGAGGITYYYYNDFTDSPLDFYYHARALSMIRPYEDLIIDGEVLNFTGINKEQYYSAVKKDHEMLLLVGNYKNASEQTMVELPFKKIEKIIDLRSDEKINADIKFKFNVPKGDIRLFYISGQ